MNITKSSFIGDALINLYGVEDYREFTDTEVEAINTETSRLQQAYEDSQYRDERALEYPSIGDQLDALFHAGVFPADMAAQIQAVKDLNPKP